jgi:hypothetical protein
VDDEPVVPPPVIQGDVIDDEDEEDIPVGVVWERPEAVPPTLEEEQLVPEPQTDWERQLDEMEDQHLQEARERLGLEPNAEVSEPESKTPESVPGPSSASEPEKPEAEEAPEKTIEQQVHEEFEEQLRAEQQRGEQLREELSKVQQERVEQILEAERSEQTFPGESDESEVVDAEIVDDGQPQPADETYGRDVVDAEIVDDDEPPQPPPAGEPLRPEEASTPRTAQRGKIVDVEIVEDGEPPKRAPGREAPQPDDGAPRRVRTDDEEQNQAGGFRLPSPSEAWDAGRILGPGSAEQASDADNIIEPGSGPDTGGE